MADSCRQRARRHAGRGRLIVETGAVRVPAGEGAVSDLQPGDHARISVTDTGSRHRTLFFRDPDGNLLEVFAEL